MQRLVAPNKKVVTGRGEYGGNSHLCESIKRNHEKFMTWYSVVMLYLIQEF
jgi:hypothetical protein